MRLFTKIFLFGALIFGLGFSASGYFLLRYSLESSLAREEDFALKQYQYDKFTVQSAMLTDTVVSISMNLGDEGLAWEESWVYTIQEKGIEGDIWTEEYEDLFSALASELSVPAAFFAEDHTPLYSDIQGVDSEFLDSLTEDAHTWQYCKSETGGSILVGSVLWQEGVSAARDEAAGDGDSPAGRPICFVTQWDVSKTLQQQDTLQQYFLRCYLIVTAAGMILLVLLSALLTGPLNRMSGAARRIAAGDYKERLSLSGRDEIGALAESFNQMAEA